MAEDGKAPKPGTEFTAKVYKEAAEERAQALQGLYESGEYALALYLAGVAVESMFRAYRFTFDPEFSSRHDLFELAKESKFGDKVPEGAYEKCMADLGAVATRWSNNHRFRSRAAILKYLKRAALDRRIKGDVLKENARRAINAAIDLIALGSRLWQN
jgi:HEPN domain-containing protein